MNKEIVKQRTKQLAIRIINMVEKMPNTMTSNVIGGQLLRSGTSIGANYRACCRAKSTRDFVNKLKIVEEEADETLFWLELIEETKIFKSQKLLPLKTETNEILSIIVASIKTSKKRTMPTTP
ncbi:MAG: four helix bundle protein [Bacteroidota bacterium]